MDSNKQERTGSKTSLWKLFFGLIFFPFTISYLVLKQKQFPIFVRVLIVLIFWGIFIKIGSSESNKPNTTTESNKTEVVSDKKITPSTAPEPTKELTFKDRLLAIAQKATDKGATVEYDEKGKLATVTVPKTITYWDDTAIVKSSWGYFVRFGQEAFKLPEVDEIGVIVRMDFVDAYGKEAEGNGITIYMKKASFEKFNWENLRFKDISQQLTENGDYFVHGALWKNVKQKDLKFSY